MLSFENKTPNKDAFAFSKIADALASSGHYLLEYVLEPALPGSKPLRVEVRIVVVPGPPAALLVAGEGP